MKVIVLGSGIIGTSSAWFLKKQGHDVTVIERQPGAAQETSFANGCQISVSHAEPWANPSAPLKVLKWLGKEDAPLLFRPRAEWLQWLWGMSFLRECTPGRTADNIRQIVAISEYSRQTLQAVRAETGIDYDCLTKGILHFYTDKKEFDDSLPAAKLMRDLGCQRDSIGADEVVRIEPALASIRDKIVGGDYTETDESGDVYKFTSGLAKKAAEAGVDFQFNTSVTRLLTEGSGSSAKVVGVEVIDAEGRHKVLRADSFVMAMGSFSQPLLKPLGVNLMIYPGKGYSATYQITNPDEAPTVSLTDDGYKLVVSRLGDRLRVAGTCEVNGYGRDLNTARCEAITRRTRELFPNACDYENPTYWTGLRPLTPSNVPYIGKTKYSNLYLNTGHGTLGWTMGAGSGRAIADIVSGHYPEVDFAFTGIARRNPGRILLPA
ncbi:D-amino acid dehydrogenase [Undibacterium sp. RTI2.1]|uniref:D-amino acid dehydrogenase n=1 Tax=unclassified Undibacterium TaxID=2630295 RepID=UPI002AB43B2E|nr:MULTISPECIES: D-amino acid dehydrogenase [unclassified Undibacterium]MDY7538127.1 D-amino acid dehydrogenase [Undibacterium sp. 5I1]MEB0032868.1 D-amino acid dehydrogenase [Undibacterium sp. RTI2.1]MEB0116727.1 D-amino acid dehydrogenase [Undibacterium sp. RTI2.2]MEB0232881.1 D-amino acid dehydrogenase [Undibacterium sp. 10I3]MEB0257391.1 D-amino acid dehydrogenase [Undibacterium sp. 5I1]